MTSIYHTKSHQTRLKFSCKRQKQRHPMPEVAGTQHSIKHRNDGRKPHAKHKDWFRTDGFHLPYQPFNNSPAEPTKCNTRAMPITHPNECPQTPCSLTKPDHLVIYASPRIKTPPHLTPPSPASSSPSSDSSPPPTSSSRPHATAYSRPTPWPTSSCAQKPEPPTRPS